MSFKEEMFKNSNISNEVCPVCNKKLRYKSPCCSDKNAYLICSCGYKKVAVIKNV